MAARRTQTGPATSYALVIAAGAVLGAGAATYFGVPGAPIVWVALMVAGWLEQVPMFTGKKDQRGFPTPSHPGEQKAMNTYRFWKDLRWRLACPTTDWLPGWPVLGSWLAALLAGALCTFAPIRPDLPPAIAWVNAACAFVVVAQVLASRRRTVAEGDPCPGTRVDSLPALLADRTQALSLSAALVAAAGVAAYASSALVPQWIALTGPLGAISPWAFDVLTAFAAAGAVVAHPLQVAALATWRELVVVRRQWSPRWLMLKMDPAPYLVAHRTVGAATVDTFDAPPPMGAAAFYQMSSKITPTLGTNMRVAVLETPNQDGQGQPVPGTCHPLRFEVVMWPTDQIPDITAPGTEPAAAELLIRCAMGWAADAGGFARFVLTGCDLVTAPDAAAVWATQWATTSGIELNYIRNNARGDLAGGLSADVLVDHRAMGGSGLMLVGPALDPSTGFNPDSGLTAKAMAEVAEEDEWRRRWAGTLKQDVNAPVPQFDVKAEGELADGTKVFYQPFVTLTGEDPAQFMTGLEAKMAATIPGSASFVSIARYSVRGTARAGERHSQALTVAYSLTPVPPVNKMAPVRGDAPKWVLAGHINAAFTAARLTRPEVLSVQCLTLATSREHIWQVNVRLFDVTLSDVRGAAARIKGSLGAGIWLRIATHPEGCTIYAGGFPAKVKLARPERDTPRLVALDWEQAWLDSKVSGVNAQLPALTNVGSLPKNDQVQVLDFDLPPGIAMGDIKDATDKLRTATANSFIDVREGVNGAASVRLLVCEVSPMPTFAPFDFAEIDNSTAIPFATGVEGEAVCYDFLRDPHLLVVGGTGSGKSATLQALIYAALVLGCDMYIADPTKGGADFQFAMPWVKSFTTDVYDAAAMMNGVYAEVQRRKNLNAAHGVGSYLELPDDIRPPHAVIVLDEFTSLMMTDQLQKPDLEDEEAVREYESLQSLNSAKQLIGSKSGRIAREARSAGMTLLLATQRLTAKTLEAIPGAQDLRSNMSRLILGKATLGELQSALKDPYSAPPMGDSVPRGRGLLEVSGERVQLVQSWYVQDIQSVLAANLTERRQPLDPSKRMDLTAFMPRRPEHERPDNNGNHRAPARTEPVVVELDDLEMSLDDLATGDDEVGAELPAWAAEFAAARALDVEPDVDPFREVEAKGDAAPRTTASRPDVVLFGDALGRACETLVPTGADMFGWWKADAVLAWLDTHPGHRRVVFADDELDDVDELDTPHRDVLAEVLGGRGVKHLLLTPEGGALSPGELAEVERFLAGEVRFDDAVLADAFTDDSHGDGPEPVAVASTPTLAAPPEDNLAAPAPAQQPAVSDWDATPQPPRPPTRPRRLTAPVADEW